MYSLNQRFTGRLFHFSFIVSIGGMVLFFRDRIVSFFMNRIVLFFMNRIASFFINRIGLFFIGG